AGSRYVRRVGILVDANLLDGGRRNGQSGNRDAINDQLRYTGADGAGVQERGNGRHVILVEDGPVFEQVLIDGDGVFVFTNVGGNLGRFGGVDTDLRNDLG